MEIVENSEISFLLELVDTIELDLLYGKKDLAYYMKKRDHILNLIEYRIDMIGHNNHWIDEYRKQIINETGRRNKLKTLHDNICVSQEDNKEYESELKLLRICYDKYFFDGAEKFYV